MKFTPLNDRILVEYDAPEQVTASGLFLPETVRKRPLVGKVVEIGKSKDGITLPLKVGDTILHSKGDGSDIKIDGKDYIILKYSDIIAKLD